MEMLKQTTLNNSVTAGQTKKQGDDQQAGLVMQWLSVQSPECGFDLGDCGEISDSDCY